MFSSADRQSSVSSILDMIERKAPSLIKAGGINATYVERKTPKTVTDKDVIVFVERFTDLIKLGYTEFKACEIIGAETDFSEQTVRSYINSKKPKTNLTKR
jgi:hypothetical protein